MSLEELPLQQAAIVGGGSALASYLLLRKQKPEMTKVLVIGGCAAGAMLLTPTVLRMISPGKVNDSAPANDPVIVPPVSAVAGQSDAPKSTMLSIMVTGFGTGAFHYYVMREEGGVLESILAQRGFKTPFTYGGKTYRFNANWSKFGKSPNEVRKVQVLNDSGASVNLQTIFGRGYEGKTFRIAVA